MELYIVRHGQSMANAGMSIFNSPLTELGLRQADALGAELSNIPFDRIYGSTLSRAAQTAGGIAARQPNPSVPVQIVPELVEAGTPQDFVGNRALLTGVHTHVQLERMALLPFESNDARAKYVLDEYVFKPAYCESFDTEKQDADGNVIRSRDLRVLMATHGVFIAYLLSNLVHFPFDPNVVVELTNTGVSHFTLYTFNGVRRVKFHCYNNTRHLTKDLISK